MKRLSFTRSVAALATIAVVVGACSGSATPAPSAAASAAASVAAASPSAAAKTYTIGVSYPTSNSPFWQAYLAFLNDGAKQLGITINAVSADTNEQKQVADIQNLISQGVDGMIISAPQRLVKDRAPSPRRLGACRPGGAWRPGP